MWTTGVSVKQEAQLVLSNTTLCRLMLNSISIYGVNFVTASLQMVFETTEDIDTTDTLFILNYLAS